MEEKGRFSKTSYSYASVLFRIKGTLVGKYVTISISLTENKNYINPEVGNQLVISESNIIEKLYHCNIKQYDITDLLLDIEDYTFIF